MFSRKFSATREERNLLGSFKNFAGRMKRRLDGLAREFGVEVKPNVNSHKPTITHLDGAMAYDIVIDGEHQATLSISIDDFGRHLALHSSGPLFGDKVGFSSAADNTFEVMIVNLRSHLQLKNQQATDHNIVE